MTATLHDLLKSYREGGVFPSYDQLAAIAGQDQGGAAVRGEAVAKCTVPPIGWRCTRIAGHEGPCAAYPIDEAAEKYEAEMLQVIDQRDKYHDMADQLAAQIAAMTEMEIGEHSSDNEPWRNALIAGDEFIAAKFKAFCNGPVSARAADAPSEPSDDLMQKMLMAMLECTASELSDYSPCLMDSYEGNVRAVYAAIVKSRAADTPSEPSESVMRAALERIARWHGEFPGTGKTWPDGGAVSYAAEYGSNGERDYMRQVALDALKSRAADALDSQLTDQKPAFMAYFCKKFNRPSTLDFDDLSANELQYYEFWQSALASSQPTDGGVRNG